MKPRWSKLLRGEEGFLLPIIMVFAVVLFVAALAAAVSTRSDVSIVNNLRNEKTAFFAAEAGASEALLRLSMKPGTASTTVGANTFNPRILPDYANKDWTGYVLFAGTAPATTGNPPVLTTPTLQPASTILPYSATTTTDASKPGLQLAWEKNLANTAIKRINGKRVMDIISTGQSGTARRTTTLAVISDNIGNSAIFLDPHLCGSANLQTATTFPGALQVNSDCRQDGNQIPAFYYSTNQPDPIAPDINIVAARSSPGDAYSATLTTSAVGTPTPNTGQPQSPDPFAALATPTIPAGACTAWSGTPATGVKYCGFTISGTTTFPPSTTPYIFDGPVTVSGSGRVIGSGVTFYITNNGSLTLGGVSPTLVAPSSGTYAGVLIFQDRTNANPIRLTGSFAAGSLDGLIYAKSALVDDGSSGTSKILNVEMVTAGIKLQGGQATFAPPSTPLLSAITFQAYQQAAWKDF